MERGGHYLPESASSTWNWLERTWDSRARAGPGGDPSPWYSEYLRKEASMDFFFFFSFFAQRLDSQMRLNGSDGGRRRSEDAAERKRELNQFWMSTVSATTCTLRSRGFGQSLPVLRQIHLWTDFGDQLIRFWGSKVTADSYFLNTLRDF